MDMQPNPPSGPHQSAAPRPQSSVGSGLIVGLLALLAFVYLMDHASKGEAAVFGGVDRRISETDFHSAQCTAVFGGCKIDLRDAQIQGREAVLSTYAVFGGVEIRVPENWEVVSRGVAIFGGFENRTRRPSGPDTKTLILDGAAVFGGVTVKD
jgi:Cell wall-active antibiotics response LiaF, C-terminal